MRGRTWWLAGMVVVLCAGGCAAAPVRAAHQGAKPGALAEIAAAPVLPGAVEVQRSPERSLDDTFGPIMVVDLNRWWTAPGTVDQAMAFFRTHPPVGMLVDGTGQGSGPGTDGYVEVLYGRTSTGDARYGLDVYVTSHGNGVAVRANIQDTGVRAGSA